MLTPLPNTIPNVRGCDYQNSSATELRFVQRGEKRILQQNWTTQFYSNGKVVKVERKWHDVPLVDEAADPA